MTAFRAGARARKVARAVGLGALLFGAAARAQSDGGDSTAAERARLLVEAEAARDANDHARALEIAERAVAMRVSPSLRLFVANEQFALGRYAEASATARQCQQDVRQNPTVSNGERIEAACRQLYERLRGRIGLLVVRLGARAGAGTRVRVNGVPLDEAFYGVPYVVNPGAVRLERVDGAGRVESRELMVEAGQTVEARFDAAALEAAVVSGAPGPQTQAGAAAIETPARGARASLVPPAVLLSAGVLTTALSPLLLLPRDAALDALRAGCDTQSSSWNCDPRDDLRDAWGRAQGFHAAFVTGLALGSALTLVGGAWLAVRALAPAAPPAAPSREGFANPSASLAAGVGSIAFRLRFH